MAQATYSIDAVPTTETRSNTYRSVINFLKTYPYVLPAIIFFVGWQILPIYHALRLSFTDDRFLDQVPNLRVDKPFEPQQLRALVNERVR